MGGGAVVVVVGVGGNRIACLSLLTIDRESPKKLNNARTGVVADDHRGRGEGDGDGEDYTASTQRRTQVCTYQPRLQVE